MEFPERDIKPGAMQSERAGALSLGDPGEGAEMLERLLDAEMLNQSLALLRAASGGSGGALIKGHKVSDPCANKVRIGQGRCGINRGGNATTAPVPHDND